MSPPSVSSIVVVLVLCSLPVLARQAPTPVSEAGAGEVTLHAVESGGQLRWFRVAVPAGATPGEPLPLVLGFHGGGGNALQFGESSGLIEACDARGVLLVLPEGTGVLGGPPLFKLETWNGGDCCGYAQKNDIDDVGFVDDLLDVLSETWPYDAERVIATGLSNGGIMAYRLGTELGDRITAIAPVGACNMTDAEPATPMPLLVVQGALDDNIPFEGGQGSGISNATFTSQAESVAPFLRVNASVVDVAPEQVVGAAQLHVLPSATGEAGAPVHYWWLEDAGHAWPGALEPPFQKGEPVSADVDANTLVLDFLLETVAPGWVP